MTATETDIHPPPEPICRSAENDREPCQFAGQCNERRQRVMHYAQPPIRGMACWKYQVLVACPSGQRDLTVNQVASASVGSNPTATIEDADAQLERAAIQAEG